MVSWEAAGAGDGAGGTEGVAEMAERSIAMLGSSWEIAGWSPGAGGDMERSVEGGGLGSWSWLGGLSTEGTWPGGKED